MSRGEREPIYPTKHLAAGALCFDRAGALLIVKPTYRDGWLIPGGVVEAGESPRGACAREVQEELGLILPVGQLLVIDCVSLQTSRRETVQFVFAGGVLDDEAIGRIILPRAELSDFRFVPTSGALEILTPGLARRLPHALHALTSGITIYLEDGALPMP